MLKRLLTFLILFILIPAGAAIAGSSAVGERQLLLFYSNDVIGETEPCG